MPAEPWTLQPSPSASSLGSAGSIRRGAVGSGVVPRVQRGGGGRDTNNNIAKPATSTSSPPGSSTDHRMSSSNSDTLLSSSEDEATTNARATTTAMNVSQLTVASNPHYLRGGMASSSSAHTAVSSVARSSPPTSQYRQNYYQQQQQQQQQRHDHSYLDASGVGSGAMAGVGTNNAIGRSSSSSSGTKAAETIIHFPDAIPSLTLVSFTPPPSSPVDGSFSYSHNLPLHQPSGNASHVVEAAMPFPSAHHYQHPPLPSSSGQLAQSNVDSSEGNNGSGEQGRGGGTFQSMKKRLSLRLTGGGTPSSGVVGSEVIERRLSQGNNIHHKDPVVRQYTKDSSKTLTSESTTALLVREDLKDDSSLLHKGGAGVGFGSVGGGGFGNRNNLQQNRLTLATINFQDSDYAGETRRGSTATAFSNLTQTTYGLNVNTPHSGYYSEKVGYDNNGKSSPGLNNRHSYNLSTLSPTTPNTPRESIFGMAGSNNNNQAPNGKKYIDTRKLKKQQKGDKKLAKASFSKAKSLFSNERTFLHWIKFGMLLGALAMTLLNFSGDEVARKGVDVALANKVGLIGRNVGVTLLLVCLLTLIYSATTYHWRHLGIVKDKSSTRYFDRVGPTVFTLALFMTYTINVVLTIQVTSLMDHGYEPSIYLNNVDSNSPAPQPSFPPPSISPAMPTSTLAPLPLSPPVTPALPPPQPQKPVFDAPYLPPGSTILIDGEDEDGNEYESSHSSDSGDTEDPTVNTASTSDDSSSSRSSSEETSSPESDSSNSESDHSTANSSRGGNDGNRQEEEDDDN